MFQDNLVQTTAVLCKHHMSHDPISMHSIMADAQAIRAGGVIILKVALKMKPKLKKIK